MATRSEDLFERFCSENSIPLRPVIVGKERTPDYDIPLGSRPIAVEVKQLDRDEDPTWKEGEFRLHSTTPGDHIRRKINKAGAQLRARAKAGHPSILVIYNNIYRGIEAYSEPYDFLVAMYGLQSIVVGVPKGATPYVKVERFGPKRKMTDTTNTSFSALAGLREDTDGRLSLDIFHNAHASTPLETAILSRNRIRHFAIPRGAVEFTEWEEVT